MSAITTHVLDTSIGKPAAGVPVVLDRQNVDGSWRTLGAGQTDADGRLRTLLRETAPFEPGRYRLVFETAQYFEASRTDAFYPSVTIVFDAVAGESHYHLPLLISPFGYSTYRGT